LQVIGFGNCKYDSIDELLRERQIDFPVRHDRPKLTPNYYEVAKRWIEEEQYETAARILEKARHEILSDYVAGIMSREMKEIRLYKKFPYLDPSIKNQTPDIFHIDFEG
jgi:hypothetical protein